VARALIRCLNRSPHARTLAYVVMPDHVHWLLQLTESGALSSAIRAAKSLTTREANRLRGDRGSIWQPGFHDRGVRHEADLKGIARYIVANPLRAGLARRVGDYPHWDAIWV
jgi:REP element-mobilizing transposase RayT